jgi:hypothetical protein
MIYTPPIRIYRRNDPISEPQLQQLRTILGRQSRAAGVISQEQYGNDLQYWVVIFNWHLVEESRQLMVEQIIDPAAGRPQRPVDLQSWIRSYIKFCDKIGGSTTDDDFRSMMESERQRWSTILSRVKKFEKITSESIL